MPSVSVKNVPEELLERLRARAKQNHRSLQGEMLAILEEAAVPKKLTVAEARRRLDGLDFRTPDQATQWVRENRDSR